MILAGKKRTGEGGGITLAEHETFMDPSDSPSPVPELSVCF